MRYKVQAPDPAVYHSLVEFLSGRAPVLVASEKRCFLSTEGLSDDLRAQIEARGAKVTPEFQYDLEAPSRR